MFLFAVSDAVQSNSIIAVAAGCSTSQALIQAFDPEDQIILDFLPCSEEPRSGVFLFGRPRADVSLVVRDIALHEKWKEIVFFVDSDSGNNLLWLIYEL